MKTFMEFWLSPWTAYLFFGGGLIMMYLFTVKMVRIGFNHGTITADHFMQGLLEKRLADIEFCINFATDRLTKGHAPLAVAELIAYMQKERQVLLNTRLHAKDFMDDLVKEQKRWAIVKWWIGK